MGRSLYRLYLYLVFNTMVLFAVAGAVALLADLFEMTSLRGPEFGSGQLSSVTAQQAAFGSVVLFIAAVIGGGHYYLIRRDIAGDSGAGAGPIRALFLNWRQAQMALIAVFVGAFTIAALAQPFFGDLSVPFAIAAVTAAAFLLLQLERQRNPGGPGAAIVLQRLQLYLIPLIALFAAVGFGINALSQSVQAALSNAGIYDRCAEFRSFNGPCTSPNLLALWGAAAVPAVFIAAYGLFARADGHSTLRAVFRFASLGFGVIFMLIGIERLAEWVLQGILNQPVQPADFVQRYEFVSPLLVGLLVFFAYGLWLRADAERSPMGAENTTSTLLAVMAVIAAAPFWWGCGLVLHNLIESVAPDAARQGADWATALALVVAGIAYVPLALLLAQRSHQAATPGPRRGFALGLLAAGILAVAVGAATALYALVTNVLGQPLTNWQETVRSGITVLLIGAIIAGIYGWITVHEGYLRGRPGAQPAVEAPVTPESVETLLDRFKAGTLTREEAQARIRALTSPTL